MSCPHNHVIGDNYGETCQDCGEVLAGYGYWAEGSEVCHHDYQPIDDKWEQCIYCEDVRLRSDE